jgi:hypothetical protein
MVAVAVAAAYVVLAVALEALVEITVSAVAAVVVAGNQCHLYLVHNFHKQEINHFLQTFSIYSKSIYYYYIEGMTIVPKVQLKLIEEVADKKAKEIESIYYKKYIGFYDMCIKILQKYDILLYGGTAINEIFPKKYKFYGNTELPDIDLFCISETFDKLNEELLRVFYDNGYKLTTIKEALHKNTYKLMVEGLQLLDITVIEKDIFTTLGIGKMQTSFKLNTVNIEYLKYSLHTFISQPLDSHRWSKVFERFINMYNAYPVNINCKFDIENFYLENIPKDIIKNIKTYIIKNKYPSFGWDVIGEYLKEFKYKTAKIINIELIDNLSYTPIQYISVSKNHRKIAYEILEYLNDPNISVLKSTEKHNILPKHSIIAYKKEQLIYIFETNSCASIITNTNKIQYSIHSIIHYLYILYLGTSEKTLLCTINILISLLLDNLSSTRNIYKQFITDCYGEQKGIITLRKEKYMRILDNVNNVNK